MKSKKKLLDKFIKKDYNNELEEVLSQKSYEEDVKNLLLDILYKIENAYDDYKIVKRNVLSKEEYIQNIINIIKNKCNSIKFIKRDYNNSENRTFFIDYEKKEIKCYPIEQKLLYALSKIQKKDDILRTDEEILNKAFTTMLNVGNNINTVEPLRDFNGFSWNISVNEIGNLYYNLIYQDLIFLIGNKFLEEWANNNDSIIDYMTLFQSELEKRYGNNISKNIITILKKLAILLELSINPDIKRELQMKKEDVEEQLYEMKDKEKYLENISKEKKQIEKQIRKIDIMINDKKLLHEEYQRRNEHLPLNEKIFSTRVLSNKLKKEREIKLERIKQCNICMNPKNFKKLYDKLLNEYEYLSVVDEDNLKEITLNTIVSLQKEVLRSFKIKIFDCKNKSDFMNILHEFRYYFLIPVTTEEDVSTMKKLDRLKTIVAKEFLKKAKELKIMNRVLKEEKNEVEILKKVFSLQIISLEDVYFNISKVDDVFYIQFYDENIVDEKFIINLDLKKEDFLVRLNKKTKLFV